MLSRCRCWILKDLGADGTAGKQNSRKSHAGPRFVCAKWRTQMLSRLPMATPYLLRVLRSVYDCWLGPHIDCSPPLCTSCSCYKEIGLSRRLKVRDRCWEMIWTSVPCWPTATSAGCCLSSSTPGREEAMQKASQTPESADNIQGRWKRFFVFNKEAILTSSDVVFRLHAVTDVHLFYLFLYFLAFQIFSSPMWSMSPVIKHVAE